VLIRTSIPPRYVEVYNERIRDLLNPALVNLQVRESKREGIWIEGVTVSRLALPPPPLVTTPVPLVLLALPLPRLVLAHPLPPPPAPCPPCPPPPLTAAQERAIGTEGELYTLLAQVHHTDDIRIRAVHFFCKSLLCIL